MQKNDVKLIVEVDLREQPLMSAWQCPWRQLLKEYVEIALASPSNIKSLISRVQRVQRRIGGRVCFEADREASIGRGAKRFQGGKGL